MQHIVFPVSSEAVRTLALGLPLSLELPSADIAEIVAYWVTRDNTPTHKAAIFDLKKELEMLEDAILLDIARRLPLGVICYEVGQMTVMTDRFYICQP
jgi:hypothetical protein